MNHSEGLEIFGEVILRTAGMSNEKFDYNDLAGLLKDRSFQTAIFFASKTLFIEIQKHEFEFDKLPERAKNSIRKYYNRYCYRTTPFGLFSVVGTANWSSAVHQLKLSAKPVVDLRTSSAFIMKKCLTHFPITQSTFFLNQTVYSYYNEVRFYQLDLSNELKISFKLNAVRKSRALSQIFDFLKIQRTYRELVAIADNFYEDAEGFVSDLVESGLIIPAYYPAMTNFDYYGRLKSLLTPGNDTQEKMMNSVTMHDLRKYEETASNKSGNTLLNHISPISFEPSDFYVNMIHPKQESIPAAFKEQLMNVVRCLSILHRKRYNPAMADFKKRFADRFGNTRQPLMNVLDPELGIGYLKAELTDNEQIGGNVRFEKNNPKKELQWTDVHELLINKFLKKDNNEDIKITEGDLEKVNKQNDVIFPPSFSVSFSKIGNELIIHYVGGSSANNIASRFSFYDSICSFTKRISEAEERNNPDSILADLVCLTDGRVLDINTRQNVYNHQIPLFVSQSTPGVNQIIPADIDVQLTDGRLVLRSSKSDKEIIPRINSVYNHNHHTLPLFRFLGDLQHENFVTNITFDIVDVIPGLKFYPRVSFGSCILSLATWFFDSEEIKQISNAQDPVKEIREQLNIYKIPNTFRVVEHDNSLFYDSHSDDSMMLLTSQLKNHKPIQIKEVLQGTSFVLNSDGYPLEHEIIAAVINKISLSSYREDVRVNKDAGTNQKRFFLGENWLYYKIYCMQASADELIATDVNKVIRLLLKKDLIKKWFFIRYADPDPHIRLRVEMKGRKVEEIIDLFNQVFRKKMKNRAISQMVLLPYERETERYGDDLIDKVEEIFCVSSSLVIDCLRDQYLHQTYLMPYMLFATVDLMINSYTTEYNEKRKFVSDIVQKMEGEFNIDAANMILLNERYREIKHQINSSLSSEFIKKLLKKKKYLSLKLALDRLLIQIGEKSISRKRALISDLIHMHINRYLSEDQRMQEFILAYFLKKSYLTIQKKKNKSTF